MAGEWVKRKIGALGRVVTGKTPPTSDSSNYGGPYLFITIPDLNGRVFIDRTERTISEKGAKLIASSLLPPGSVMMSCIATVGKCGITTAPSFTNQQINSVIPNDDVDPRFLYYAFTELGHQLEAIGAGGSVYTNVSKKRFSDIEVTLPVDINEQRAIAHILGTLDDKIELNRRMSETLEAMGRVLFKAWFVDFEPVRAKMEGRWQRGQSLPGLPAHLYDLFPDRLVESELGEIPEGWEVKRIGDLAEVFGGSTPRTDRSEYWEGARIIGSRPRTCRRCRCQSCSTQNEKSPTPVCPRSAPACCRRARCFFRLVRPSAISPSPKCPLL
jgi:type I restriction enzyme S subunit